MNWLKKQSQRRDAQEGEELKKYKMTSYSEYEVDAVDEDDALVKLEEDLGAMNATAQTEFWNNMKAEEIK